MNSSSRIRGGAALLIASLLLVVATVCEAPLLDDSHPGGPLFWVFVVTFVLASIGYLVAVLLLVAGPGARTAAWVAARIGLIAFGVLWLVAQVLYLFGAYFTPSDGLLLVSTILSLLMIVGGLVAGIAIGARAIVRGAGRWSLLIGVLISGITGGIVGTSTSSVLATVLHLISSVALALVGVTYLLARSGTEADANAR